MRRANAWPIVATVLVVVALALTGLPAVATAQAREPGDACRPRPAPGTGVSTGDTAQNPAEITRPLDTDESAVDDTGEASGGGVPPNCPATAVTDWYVAVLSGDSVPGEPVGATQARSYEAPARAGAEDALAALEARGVDVDAATRAAAIQGAIAGATLVEQGSANAPPDAATVRAAASGAVTGALDRAGEPTPSPETIRSVVSGALAGASLSTALGAAQGGLAAPFQALAAAHGGAEGTVATVSRLSGDHQAALTAEHVQFAAFGGAGGAAGAASLLPIFADGVDAGRTHAAAFGGAAGALQGTADQLVETGRVDPGQTLGSSLGASAGALSATLQHAELTERQLSDTAYAVSRETVRRADVLTQDQMLETALTTAVERLLGDAAGDSVFPSAIVLPGYSVAIGPPRDVDADGTYEDVNGNLVLTYADVVSLSILRSLTAEGAVTLSSAQRAGLDFSGDGVFDWRDIRALDEEITAITNGTV